MYWLIRIGYYPTKGSVFSSTRTTVVYGKDVSEAYSAAQDHVCPGEWLHSIEQEKANDIPREKMDQIYGN